MRIIGITGGVGAGKSKILHFIADTFAAAVVEADQVGYLVMQPGAEAFDPIVELFGKEILTGDGRLDREEISRRVFRDRELLERLNAIVHPAVKAYIRRAMEKERQAGTPFFIVEAALLLEDKYDEICDELWYIYADEETRIQRLMKNRGYTEEKSRRIIANQLGREEFESRCDVKIDNSGEFEATKEQILQRMRIYETM